MPPEALFLASWKCFASKENISLAIRLPKRTMVVPIGFLVAALRGEEEGKWF
jgi:hypothetical protein